MLGKKLDFKKNITKLLVIIFLLVGWYGLTTNQTDHAALLFPSPSSVFNALLEKFNEFMLFSFKTWYRVIAGLLLGGVIGFFVAIFMTYNKWVDYLLDPIIEFVRPIPPVALTPFFILWFGLGDSSQLLLISLGCMMIILIATYEAIRNVNPTLIRAAKSLGADTLTLYKTVMIPSIIPSLLPATRVALASAFALTVAAEYLGAQGGLGYMIRNARTILQTEVILLCAVFLGIESLISDYLIRKFFSKITEWQPTD